MIRLFTGLAVPSDISTDLSTLRGGLLGARWIEPTDYHVTLQFAGSIEEDIAAELDDELLRLRKSPVDIVLDGIHIFGGAKPRAVVVGVRTTPSLLDLQASHARIMRKLGISIDNRKYVPHVTIARLKSITPDAVADYVNSRGYFRPRNYIAEQFNLYSSAGSAGGGPYSIEAEYELRN